MEIKHSGCCSRPLLPVHSKRTIRLPLNIAKGVYTLKMISKEGVGVRMVVVE
jgi:hypothetical protein